ncbi:hypothetical protein TYRP_020341 [Tyrophagus putrescentiae]|nr:hypothetical protein TYRP_020205 [Tyrophagus putrescentiae]KAH9395926.1 hypothetical protein TYRP_020341 [Tyrophagus putrescentiae]
MDGLRGRVGVARRVSWSSSCQSDGRGLTYRQAVALAAAYMLELARKAWRRHRAAPIAHLLLSRPAQHRPLARAGT